MFSTFAQMKAHALASLPRQRCAVAGAADEHTLHAVLEAAREGFVRPVLIGPQAEVRAMVAAIGPDVDVDVVDCPADQNPATVAVRLVRAGSADFILKGAMATADLLRPVLDRATGLRASGLVTHFGYMQIAGYPKLLAMSDSAVVPYPTLADKEQIVDLCVDALRRLGVARPVVAALCAVETVSPRMPETLDAQELARLGAQGRFGDTVVLGPISYDLATSAQAAAIKGYACAHSGDVDMLLVPHMVTGNVLSKVWNADARNALAGCLLGARVPVALTSRSASTTEKLTSLLLCSVLSAAGPVPATES